MFCSCVHFCIRVLVIQWRYCIRLENLGNEVVQLRERHWRIFSLSGTLETVRGRGVVGRVSIRNENEKSLVLKMVKIPFTRRVGKIMYAEEGRWCFSLSERRLGFM